MANIFISYRRSDSAPYAGRLHDRLSAHFGEPQVFMDLEIEPGEDFVSRIERGVSQCEVLLVLIGPSWLDATDGTGRRRLDDPDDFARIEVVAALEREIRVIPVLVGGASMPNIRDLPADLAPLGRRQALELSDARFRADADRLIELIDAEVETRAETVETERKDTVAASSGGGRPRWLVPAAAAALLAVLVVLLLVAGVFGGSGGGGDETTTTAGGSGGRANVVVSGPASAPQAAPNPLRIPRGEGFSLLNSSGVPLRINSGDQQTQILAGSSPIPPAGSGAYLLEPDSLLTVSIPEPVLDQAGLEFRAGDALATLEIEFLD